jgi:hypothetical protein
VGTVLSAVNTALAGQVDRVLAAAGLPAAPRLPGGHPAGDGYTVDPMTQCGPARVAVRWHHAAPCPDGPGPVLSSIAFRLTTAGYLVETVYAAAGPYLAVLPPPGS